MSLVPKQSWACFPLLIDDSLIPLHKKYLFSLVAPQIAPFTIGEEPANWGEQVSAICSVLKGDQPIEIRWSLNSQPIDRHSFSDISITKSGKMISLLSIDSVSAQHAGEYTCEASNQAGGTSRSATLVVNGTQTW